VTFPASNLEAAIRRAVNKPTGNITAADLAPLADLDAPAKLIADITGIEYCVNLSELWLGGNQISDISPLATMTDLTVLWLQGNQISADISARIVFGTFLTDVTFITPS
jgi:Leucine-rich repeat (LRR) protein